jgi:hypothetical protein
MRRLMQMIFLSNMFSTNKDDYGSLKPWDFGYNPSDITVSPSPLGNGNLYTSSPNAAGGVTLGAYTPPSPKLKDAFVKILSFQVNNNSYEILGLGDDDKMYRWDKGYIDWVIIN